jgi:hypothetical protein
MMGSSYWFCLLLLLLECTLPLAPRSTRLLCCCCCCWLLLLLLLLPAAAATSPMVPLACTMRIWSSSGSCLSAPCTPMLPF